MAGNGSILVTLLVSLVSSSGLLGVIVALVKLRGHRDSVVVSQATGANEALAATIAAVERERDYWKHRYDEVASVNDELLAMLGRRPPRDRR